ncbi:MAG: DUF1492 domain-containing protein [Clostridia bacterium]|nr:DUF1492 domain-containing protein [Clostridia bacterium]
MNFQEAKKYLNRGYMARQRIESKKERLERWRAELTNATVRLDSEKVGNSSDKQQMEKTVIAIIDLETQIENDISNLAKLELEIQQEIDLVEDELQKTVLEYRHLNFMKWDSVCLKLNYSSRQIFNIYKSAILSFMKNYK